VLRAIALEVLSRQVLAANKASGNASEKEAMRPAPIALHRFNAGMFSLLVAWRCGISISEQLLLVGCGSTSP
jgi:hypothetical protein